ncbi:unnamed protein product [Brassica oleracea var. botrytis]|uniref:Uncharacterized protein n=2 Tax=Brassica oleracea TaxID=3712 RepID=A0A0D3C4E3_BRAOL|nr:unnamed protein product [Brassica oleracea]
MTIKRRFGLNRRMHPVLISLFTFHLLERICFFGTVLKLFGAGCLDRTFF